MFEAYLKQWHLRADGDIIVTPSSRLLPVIQRDGTAAMLKIAIAEEEILGANLMIWWAGQGAARVLATDDNVLLLEKAQQKPSLVAMSRSGKDDEASKIICDTVELLHAIKPCPQLALIPLDKRFEPLFQAARAHRGFFMQPAAMAKDLLQSPRETVVLHGDIHHANILWFGERGWLAIDPKGLIGERGFDYANLFCNPDIETATSPNRLEKQVAIVTGAANLERERLLRWIIAYCGLSAVWTLEQYPSSIHKPNRLAGVVAAALKLTG